MSFGKIVYFLYALFSHLYKQYFFCYNLTCWTWKLSMTVLLDWNVQFLKLKLSFRYMSKLTSIHFTDFRIKVTYWRALDQESGVQYSCLMLSLTCSEIRASFLIYNIRCVVVIFMCQDDGPQGALIKHISEGVCEGLCNWCQHLNGGVRK